MLRLLSGSAVRRAESALRSRVFSNVAGLGSISTMRNNTGTGVCRLGIPNAFRKLMGCRVFHLSTSADRYSIPSLSSTPGEQLGTGVEVGVRLEAVYKRKKELECARRPEQVETVVSL